LLLALVLSVRAAVLIFVFATRRREMIDEGLRGFMS